MSTRATLFEEKKMLQKTLVPWIVSIVVIAHCCSCIQANLFQGIRLGFNAKINSLRAVDSKTTTKTATTATTAATTTAATPSDFHDLYLEYLDEIRRQANGLSRDEIRRLLESELSRYLNVSQYSGALCNRECETGKNRICYYEFTLEWYQAMGVACGRCAAGVEADCNNPQCIVGDGFEKGVMSINRQIPGPAIHVCKNDLVIVDVHNRADGSSATIHWHGIHMRDSPHMDGVPFVTQCPIHYANSFRYIFNATEPGTQFYHSHSGHHKANGQYGVLTVRQPKEDEPLRTLYDFDLPEHSVFIVDWMHSHAEHLFPGLPSTNLGPDSVLINDRGVFTNATTFERTNVRPTIFYVTRGQRYLFRLVNAVSHFCPFSMQIENHEFTVVASDSFTVLPSTFDTLISNAGERYDFILNANKPVGDYWMRVRGLGSCADTPIESYALIRYADPSLNLTIPPFPNYSIPLTAVAVLNHPNATCWDGNSDKCVTELTAYDDDDDLRYENPDHKFFLAFNNYPVANQEIFQEGRYFHFENAFGNLTLVSAINNLSLVFPPSPPLTQPETINESQFCDGDSRPAHCNGTRICHCTHRLKVKLNSIVELIIVDETENINNVNHPFHLHGYRFMVTGVGQDAEKRPMTVAKAKIMETNKLLKRDSLSVAPPYKDTVSIPSRGYAIIRLRATNPGFWLMHCHYEWHLSVGMGLILQVGEPSDMVKPPADFPKCSSFLPRVDKPDFMLSLSNFKSHIQELMDKRNSGAQA